MLISFIAVADGLAMLLPGPASPAGGAAILAAGAAWLVIGVPRCLSPSGREFSAALVTRFGLFALPALVLPIAGLWWIATPAALSVWFAVAWLSVWVVCVALSALLPCPRCGLPFGRQGLRFQTTSDACAHCGASARGERS